MAKDGRGRGSTSNTMPRLCVMLRCVFCRQDLMYVRSDFFFFTLLDFEEVELYQKKMRKRIRPSTAVNAKITKSSVFTDRSSTILRVSSDRSRRVNQTKVGLGAFTKHCACASTSQSLTYAIRVQRATCDYV